jgi:putative cardiolipin synthase
LALTDAADTRLAKAISPRAAANPGKSGIYALADSRDAFAARVRLARRADRTLDVQSYIWRADMSGTLLFKELCDAAGRGVKVRLLLDDHNTSGLDAMLAALDAHPNIEVRLFNPVMNRAVRWLGYLGDFSRLNRRMHNKSFTADSQATVIGGRNVGDEYFDAAEGMAFVDLDVLAAGPIVKKVSEDFERYWTSASSWPLHRVMPAADAGALAQLAAAAARIERDPAAAAYMEALCASDFVRELIEGRLALEWAPVRMVSDDPAKALGRAAPEGSVLHKLKEIVGEPAERIDLVSAYFVPAEPGTAAFAAMARRGVIVEVLTNSLEATDVAVVHAGYAKRRKALLQAGVPLFELRRLSPSQSARGKGRAALGSSGSSSSSLHAKTFAVDGARVFIGSFNFDPRSVHLNTEMGFVIDSPALAQRIDAAFADRIRAQSYEVRLSDMGGLYWIENRERREVRHDTEPGTAVWQRAAVRLLSLLPIEWLL